MAGYNAHLQLARDYSEHLILEVWYPGIYIFLEILFSSLICRGFWGIWTQIGYKRTREWNTVHDWLQICPAATVTLCHSLCSFGIGKKHWFVDSTGKYINGFMMCKISFCVMNWVGYFLFLFSTKLLITAK
jgi:hypothetical protein